MRWHPSFVRAAVVVVAAGVAATAALPLAAVPAAALDQSTGRPGFCTDGVGVTVVIDFQQLGGETIVRCDPQGTRGTGLDAVKGAGFQVAGVQRWGEAFICRIENRPSAVETLPLQANGSYREPCIDTPPASAYWSYWHAGNNCQWEYSQWGVKNRDFTPGGFEGWSFSLNATAGSNPKPRIAAVRPGTTGQPCATPKEQGPKTNDPGEEQQPRSDGTSGGAGGSDGAGGTGSGGGSTGTGSSSGGGTVGVSGGSGTGSGGSVSGGSGGVGSGSGGGIAGGSGGSGTGSGGSVSGGSGGVGSGSGGGIAGGSGGSGSGSGGSVSDGSGGPESASGGSTTSSRALPPPVPRTRGTSSVAAGETADDPARNVSFTGGENSRDVTDLIEEQSGASDYAPWVAGAVIVALGALTWFTAARRRRARRE